MSQNTPTKDNEPSLRTAMISGAAWMVAMRWAVRGIGVVSTIILVRLLAPDDFGLIAMCYLVVSLLEVLTAFGVDLALIQNTEADKDHYDTAWTIRLLQTILVAVLLIFIAPYAAVYFSEPRVTALMWFLSVGVLSLGFTNIGIVAFRKDLEFSKEFIFTVVHKIGSFVVTISLALWLRSYWALAGGIVAGNIISVAVSYFMHPYRPSLSLKRFKELWSFSQWILVRNIAMYVRRRIGDFLVARFFTTGQMGYYSIGMEVSQMPTTELIWPMARALFPGYAKLSHDKERMGQAYLNVLNSVALIVIPTGVGMALVAEPMVLVGFGEEWLPVVPVLRWLSAYGVFLTLVTGVQTPLIAMGRMRRTAALAWAQTLLAVPAVAYSATKGSLEIIAATQMVTAALLAPLFYYAITSLGLVRWSDILRALWRPAVAAIAMTAALAPIRGEWFPGPVSHLVLKVIVGAAVFVGTDLLLWNLAKRPDGGEYSVMKTVAARFPRLGLKL